MGRQIVKNAEDIAKRLDIARIEKQAESKNPLDLLELNFSFPSKLAGKYEQDVREIIGSIGAEVVLSEEMISGVSCTLIKHKEACPKRKLMYIHGGAFMFGSIEDYYYLCVFLSKFSQCEIVFVNYRLAPEYPFPAALDDCCLVYKELQKQNNSKLYLCGDSAGATLCFGLTFQLRRERIPLPAAIASVCVSADEERKGKSWADNKDSDFVLGVFADVLVKDRGRSSAYLNGHSTADELVSPCNGDFKGFPPVLLQASNVECLRDDSILLYTKMCSSGVDVRLDIHDQVPHVWHLYAPVWEEARESVRQIGCFLLER